MERLLASGKPSAPPCEKPPRRASRAGSILRGPGAVVGATQLAVEPDPGVRPVAVRRGARDAEGLGRLLNGQPAEVAQGDEPGLDRVLGGEPGQGLVEGQQ